MTHRLTALTLMAAGAIQIASAMPASAAGSLNATTCEAVAGKGLHADDAGLVDPATGSAALRRFDAGAGFDLNAVEAIGKDPRAGTVDAGKPERIALPAVQRP